MLTDVTLTQSDLHIVGDVSDSGRAKAITQDLLEDYIANSPNFISELTSNATFISDINTIAPSPLTTKGDLFTFSTVSDRLPVGTDGQVLSANSAETTGLKWIDLVAGGGGGTKLAINTTAFSHTGDTTETTMFTVSIPAGTLGTNDAIRFYILGHADGDSNNVTFRTKYGASTVATVVDSSGSDDDYIYSGMIIADNLTNAQVSSNQFVKSGNITGASDGTDSVIDSTVDQNLVITMQLASAGGTVTAKGIIVEKISAGSSGTKKVGVGEVTDDDAFNSQLVFSSELWTVSGTNRYTNVDFGNSDSAITIAGIFPGISGGSTAASFSDARVFTIQSLVFLNGNVGGFGFNIAGDTNGVTTSTNIKGVYFVSNGTNLFAQVATGAARTQLNLGSTYFADRARLRIEFDRVDATPQARFYVNGTLLATLTTNLPTTSIIGAFYNNDTGGTFAESTEAPSVSMTF